MVGSTQDVYVVASLSTLSILIVVSNVFVCSLVCFNKAPRSYTNWLIVSLAVSDILPGGVLLPVLLIKPSSIIPNYLACMILLSGVANLCSVTYDRYVAIIKPLEYQYRAPKILKDQWYCRGSFQQFTPWFHSRGTRILPSKYTKRTSFACSSLALPCRTSVLLLLMFKYSDKCDAAQQWRETLSVRQCTRMKENVCHRMPKWRKSFA